MSINGYSRYSLVTYLYLSECRGKFYMQANCVYESRREHYIPASETKGIVHCAIVLAGTSLHLDKLLANGKAGSASLDAA